MRGSKRTDAERASVSALALVVGAHEAAQQTGVPERTVRDYLASPEFAELRQRTKDQVAEEWWGGVQRGMRAVIREFDGDAPLRDKAIATGVLYDKLALMRGEATARTETRSLTDGLDDHERELLSDAIRGELARRADLPAAEVAVGAAEATGADTAAG